MVPLAWTYAESDATLILSNAETNMNVAIEGIQTSERLSDFSQLNYTQFASNNRSNFMLSSYSSGDDYIYAESTFTDTNTGAQMYLIQQLITTGTFEYILTCEIPYDNASASYEDIKNLFDSFIYY